jgi:hypothetical protein
MKKSDRNDGESIAREALGLLWRSVPLVAHGMLVYGASLILSLVWFAAAAAGALLLTPVHPLLGIAAAIAAVALWSAASRSVQRYLQYMVKGAHVAALTGFIHDDAPEGAGALAYGKERIEERFSDVNRLYAFQALIRRVLETLADKAGERFEVPERLEGTWRLASELGRRSLQYVDEAILSYVLWRDDVGVWDGARRGLLLYAQSYRSIVWATIKMWLLSKVFFVGALALLALPSIALLPVVAGQPVLLVAGLGALVSLAWTAEKVLYEPYAMAYTLVTFHRAIEDLEPGEQWDERLASFSDAFRMIRRKAGRE